MPTGSAICIKLSLGKYRDQQKQDQDGL